jgi:hypothetical protein
MHLVVICFVKQLSIVLMRGALYASHFDGKIWRREQKRKKQIRVFAIITSFAVGYYIFTKTKAFCQNV